MVAAHAHAEAEFELVELTPWTPPAASAAPLREVAFNVRAWLPEDDRELREFFAADTPIDLLAWKFDRSVTAVRDRLRALGLRRRSVLPWNDLEDEELARRYGTDAAADIAQDLGRLVSAVYTRARILGLSEPNPPAWTEWEDAQLRAGYAQGAAIPELARMIGRPLAGMISRASKLGLKHLNSSPGWAQEDLAFILEKAIEGLQYPEIARALSDAGRVERSDVAVCQQLNKLGYRRGWGRPWTAEEDDLVRQAYARGDSLTHLQAIMGRSRTSIAWRAGELGLQGTHANRNGWRVSPDWTRDQDQVLRDGYGKRKTEELAREVGRSVGGVLQRANVLGLVHGMHKPWSDEHARAVAIAWRVGIGLTDLSLVLGRQVAPIQKYAKRMGLRFTDPNRPARPRRGPRANRTPPTLEQILAQANDAERAVKAVPLKRRGAAAPSHRSYRPKEASQ